MTFDLMHVCVAKKNLTHTCKDASNIAENFWPSVAGYAAFLVIVRSIGGVTWMKQAFSCALPENISSQTLVIAVHESSICNPASLPDFDLLPDPASNTQACTWFKWYDGMFPFALSEGGQSDLAACKWEASLLTVW